MSEKEIAVHVPTEVELKQEELTFGVDEAVEVLQTMYLTNRQVKLDASSEILDRVIESARRITDEAKSSIDTSEYNHTSEVLGISSRVKDVNLIVNKTVEDSNVRVVLMLTDTDITGSNYTPEFGKYRNLPMSEDLFRILSESAKDREDAEKIHSDLRRKLDNTSEIRSRLHAKVMSFKLTKAGLGDVLKDTDILGIVNID